MFAQAVASSEASDGFSSGGTATVNDAAYDLQFFKHYGVNPFIDTEDDHLSTFAMDVDTASYTLARRFVNEGHLPNPDAVRVEEFVNFFDQGYAPPEEGAFAIQVDGSPSPFGTDNHWLVRIGLQGQEIKAENRKDATLIFVVDTSGSMGRDNRIELVKRSLNMLVDQLGPNDTVGIVEYGNVARPVLEPTGADDKIDITYAIEKLIPHGSTNAEDGLKLGYKMAANHVEPGRITRVILLSDGVANVGRTGPESILKTIRGYVDQGVTLSTIGVGMANFNDILMEQLANNGDGNYSYVDTIQEARRVFVENLTGTLQVIAKDAKVQVDFNPDVVSRYRLLGYENRYVADQDFRNDEVDAGEVGANHTVTALYELKLKPEAAGPIGIAYLRYEDIDAGAVIELGREFGLGDFTLEFADALPRFQLAAVVAEYAEVLRESYWAREGSLAAVMTHAEELLEMLPFDTDVLEFVRLVRESYYLDSER
jgi:Ca-activated chloride channel family protein